MNRILDNTKQCTKCLEEKSLDAFFTRQLKHGIGLHSWCKVCQRKAIEDARKKPESNFYKLRRESRSKLKREIVDYLGGKCTKCGLVDDPVVYDAHHLDPSTKDVGIGQLARSYGSFDKIKTELDKCVLLCSNCHRKEHYGAKT